MEYVELQCVTVPESSASSCVLPAWSESQRITCNRATQSKGDFLIACLGESEDLERMKCVDFEISTVSLICFW